MKTLCDSVSVDESKNIVAPDFLVEANSYAKGRRKVMYFLETTTLVKYDNVEFPSEHAFSASDRAFWDVLSCSLEKNQQKINTLIDDLQRSNFRQISELAEMKQGYVSKTLHVLVHFLDGFIGVDSSFYNIVEDSHQVSDSLHKKIRKNPENYWLLKGNTENLKGLL